MKSTFAYVYMRSSRCPETSGTNHPVTWRNIPKTNLEDSIEYVELHSLIAFKCLIRLLD